MDRWKDRVVVVTGASAGIGADTAKTLAEKGLIVVALARRVDKLQELLGSVPGKIHLKKCDVTNEKEVVETFEWIEKTLGGVDILINNAGVINFCSILTGPTQEWRSVVETNLLAVGICTREALKTMRKRGDDGHIIHVNSVVGHGVPRMNIPMGMYPASKHGVTALTEGMRVELLHAKSRIKVTSISPGAVITDMTRTFFEGQPQNDEIVSAFLDPSDITEAIVYALATKPGVQVHELTIQPIGHTM